MADSMATEAARPGLRRWLDSFSHGPRLVDDVECAASVLLAILFAHLVGAQNVSWAAFSGYMVMRGHIADTLLRGFLRIVGTGCGGALALFIVPVVAPSLPLSILAIAVIGGVSMYGALTARRAYAWLFVGLTFAMILLDQIEHPNHALKGFVETRMLEVVAGTCACIVIGILSSLTLRRRWPGTRLPPAPRIGWHLQAAGHAAEAAFALALLLIVWRLFALPELAQGAVSIMAVMLIPISSIGVGGFKLVSRKLMLRFLGCLIGGVVAAGVLFAAHGSAPILIVATAIGVLIGRHIENGSHGLTYIGTQFTLAILVTLVPDNYADAAIRPALERLVGILAGTAVLEPVLIISYLLYLWSGSSQPAPVAKSSDDPANE
ncbi:MULTISPECIES: FUSC family protein [unclassified Beijerinckia]|uniref:FUSC family protein n=1 Tax=unclassified Beijerinckia TaxID=2638183 RepID=UPI0008946D2B|nr:MULTISPECIES: FUSC family protein [unclassified Beijerinckia]MDH7798347.1 putative membrane protein YccC [Beijerinckia sp. GAS462]SED17910.1 Fusaric acid resistance protein family protein [Beijerinckia sp. 28-YEA-48]